MSIEFRQTLHGDCMHKMAPQLAEYFSLVFTIVNHVDVYFSFFLRISQERIGFCKGLYARKHTH